jgi:hypothetical protein
VSPDLASLNRDQDASAGPGSEVVKGVAGKEGMQQKKGGKKKCRNEFEKADTFQVSTESGRKDDGNKGK